MIQLQTILKVSDNSGAKTVKCIKVLAGSKKKFAGLGDIVVVSVQQLRNKSKKICKVKKKEVCKALIIRTKILNRKKSGVSLLFKENAVVLINKQTEPVGTRIIGVLPKTLKFKKLKKFISISPGRI